MQIKKLDKQTDETIKRHDFQFFYIWRHPMVMVYLFIGALFLSIFMNTNGLGIFSIVLAIIFFYLSDDNEFNKKIKILLSESFKKLCDSKMNFELSSLVVSIFKMYNIILKNKSKLTLEEKEKIYNKTKEFEEEMQRIIKEESNTPSKEPPSRS